LSEQPAAGHAEARRFCLNTILEFYGVDYRRDGHVDLDSLLLPAEQNHYSRQNRGAFWTLRDAAGAIVGTAGIRHLAWKPNLPAMFPDRYPSGEDVASLWRVYVRKDWRGRGLGRWLTALSEDSAARLGFATMYLHASSDAPATLAFWQALATRRSGVAPPARTSTS
jgi:GNAT superfamily N-acetyltransferase